MNTTNKNTGRNIKHLLRVQTPALLDEIMNNKSAWVLKQPLTIFQSILKEVAERAIELNDEKLNALMLRLALYEVANPKSPDYDADLVMECIEKAYNK